jgi:predicted adenylyl cyclase CyaB
VILFETKPGSPLKEILVKSVGILVEVDKLREIYFIENIKFHLDTVKDLGTFVEIEAIDSDGSIGKEKLMAQCSEYVKLFGISEKDLISVSYSDLLLEKLEKVGNRQ